MKKIRIGINGFGRIGRAFFKLSLKKDEIEIVAINDLGNVDSLAYLLKYDSVYGKSGLDVAVAGNNLEVEGKSIEILGKKDPGSLPWKKLEIDVVLEATGVFADYKKSKAHLDAGAKRVVISSPVKGEAPDGIVGRTILMGVNDEKLKTCDISSNASCTTNAGSPVLAVLEETIGIDKALLNTIHGYTGTQSLVDGPHYKDPRRGRAAAVNIIPSTSGAAISTAKAHENLEGKFDGMAIRVPVVVGSIADITLISNKDTSVEEVNDIFRKAAKTDRWKELLSVAEDPIVSTDIIGDLHASIVDL